MSKIIDAITSLIGIGIAGYFAYTVVWPRIKDLKLPADLMTTLFQQQPLQPQQPIAQQPQTTIIQIPATTTPEEEVPRPTPSPTPTVPPPVRSQDKGFEQPPKQQDDEDEDEKKGVTPPKQPTATNSVPTPTPPPSSSSSGGGTLLWDSNTHGKWNGGTGKGLQKYGSSSPGGGGMMTAASGNPSFDFDGNGVMHLTSSRWGRVYIYAKNYNSRLEGNFMFETDHGEADNISIKMRSRHGHSGHTTAGGSNQFGGVGFAFHPSGEVELAAEITHGGSSYDFGTLKGPALQLGKWHKFAISTYDGGGGINVKVDVDGSTIGTKKWANPHASAIDKAAFAADSYFWIRLNCHDGKGAKAAFNNLRLTDLGGGAATNFMSSYYSSFYNGRRL